MYTGWLIVIGILALWLRLPIPEPLWQHVDERAFILQPLAFFSGDLNPHFFNYPTLQLYLSAALYWVYYELFSSVSIESFVAYHYFVDGIELLSVARYVTTLMSVATVVAVAALGRRLYGAAGGLIAALVLAVVPLHVRFSHLAATDIPSVFWSTMAVLWAVRVAQENRPRDTVLAGVWVGLAASTKYPGVFCAIPVGVALLWSANGYRRLLTAGGAALLTLALTSPFLWLSPAEAWADISAMGREHLAGDVHLTNGSPLWHFLGHTLVYGVGLGALLTAGLALGWRPRSMGRDELVLCVGVGALSLLPAVASSGFMRYAAPVAPLVAVLTARPLVRLRLPAWAFCAWLVAVVAPPGYASWQTRQLLSGPDTRVQALQWIRALNPESYRLVVPTSGQGGVPGVLTPNVILARGIYFRRSYSAQQLRRAFAELAQRSDLPPLATIGTDTEMVISPPDSAVGTGILCITHHPVLDENTQQFDGPSRWPLEWVDFDWVSADDPELDTGIFDAADWLFVPIRDFNGVRATGPHVRLARAGLPIAAPVPSAREYFALRGVLMDADDAMGAGNWLAARALYNTVLAKPYVMEELLTEKLLAEFITSVGMVHIQLGEPERALELWQRWALDHGLELNTDSIEDLLRP